MPKLQLSMRVDAADLLNRPDLLMQHMSLRIFQRREKLIRDMLQRRVDYEEEHTSSLRSGVLEAVEDGVAVVRDGKERVRVSVRRLRLE